MMTPRKPGAQWYPVAARSGVGQLYSVTTMATLTSPVRSIHGEIVDVRDEDIEVRDTPMCPGSDAATSVASFRCCGLRRERDCMSCEMGEWEWTTTKTLGSSGEKVRSEDVGMLLGSVDTVGLGIEGVHTENESEMVERTRWGMEHDPLHERRTRRARLRRFERTRGYGEIDMGERDGWEDWDNRRTGFYDFWDEIIE
jgi:hypothetical protein